MSVSRARGVRSVGRHRLVHELGHSYLGPLWAVRADGSAGAAQLGILRLVSLASLPSDSRVRLLEAAWQAMEVRGDFILPVTDVVASDGELGVISDPAEGVTLRTLLSLSGVRRRPVPVGVALRAVQDLLVAVGTLHEASVELGPEAVPLHGGLTPDSVLVTTSGQTLVTDVAISSAAADIESLGGSPERIAYAAPEQVGPTPRSDARTDVFALGVLAWELLSGRRLFVGSEKTLAQKVLSAKIPRLEETRKKGDPELPSGLSAVLQRALERDPARRFQTVAELTEALSPHLAHAAAPPEVTEYVRSVADGPLARVKEALHGAESGTHTAPAPATSKPAREPWALLSAAPQRPTQSPASPAAPQRSPSKLSLPRVRGAAGAKRSATLPGAPAPPQASGGAAPRLATTTTPPAAKAGSASTTTTTQAVTAAPMIALVAPAAPGAPPTGAAAKTAPPIALSAPAPAPVVETPPTVGLERDDSASRDVTPLPAPVMGLRARQPTMIGLALPAPERAVEAPPDDEPTRDFSAPGDDEPTRDFSAPPPPLAKAPARPFVDDDEPTHQYDARTLMRQVEAMARPTGAPPADGGWLDEPATSVAPQPPAVRPGPPAAAEPAPPQVHLPARPSAAPAMIPSQLPPPLIHDPRAHRGVSARSRGPRRSLAPAAPPGLAPRRARWLAAGALGALVVCASTAMSMTVLRWQRRDSGVVSMATPVAASPSPRAATAPQAVAPPDSAAVASSPATTAPAAPATATAGGAAPTAQDAPGEAPQAAAPAPASATGPKATQAARPAAPAGRSAAPRANAKRAPTRKKYVPDDI